MKRKEVILVAILLMVIGFAALSTTLIINGSASVGENTEDFSVIFTKATLDGQDVYNQVIDDTKKTINFSTKELKTLNQTSVLTYEITNNSSNYDAEVSVNCKLKDGSSAKYTSIKNELEGDATKVLAKETLNGTLTVTLNKTSTEDIKEEYICTLEFNAVERDTLGKDSISFEADSWTTIKKNIETNNVENYNVGDIKEVDLGSLGVHTLRIANMSACTTETSETACGFVVEFADIIDKHVVNSTNTSVGGWRDSEIRTYVNNDIYNALPSDLQNVIATTKVISGHRNISGETNFETQDKLYLLSTKEVWGTAHRDTVDSETKQLDYYKNLGVTIDNYSKAIKQNNGVNSAYWLRAAYADSTVRFRYVDATGNSSNETTSTKLGVSPAFRIV